MINPESHTMISYLGKEILSELFNINCIEQNLRPLDSKTLLRPKKNNVSSKVSVGEDTALNELASIKSVETKELDGRSDLTDLIVVSAPPVSQPTQRPLPFIVQPEEQLGKQLQSNVSQITQ